MEVFENNSAVPLRRLPHQEANSTKMHLPEETGNVSFWTALAWDNRDVRSDGLPMMDSFAWPIGKWHYE